NNKAGPNIELLGRVTEDIIANDMGGTFNKASYVLATGDLIKGNVAPITAAMIGGLIQPLEFATEMLIFGRKLTKDQRGSIIP
ncbi:hypothetical protein FE68_15765, partial [Staphylococcus aureus]